MLAVSLLMFLWRQFIYGMRALLRRSGTDGDVSDEAQHYLDEATAALIERGVAPEDAQRMAVLESGSMTAIKEQVRSYGWENIIETAFADLRCAARGLRKNPGFTALSTLTLALGIGATTAIFSAINPILLEPLPYPHAGRLVMIWDTFEGQRSDITFHTYRELLARSRSLDELAVTDGIPFEPTMTGARHPERFEGQSVSANYFRALGVSPALGRDFTPRDDQFRGPKVVILSNALWKHLGGDTTIVGREIRLDDNLYTVIGVMPLGFENVLALSAEIWTPLQYDTRHITQFDSVEWGHHLKLIGRLRPGVTVDRARQELRQIARTPVADFPRPHWASLNAGFILDSLHDQVTRGVKPALLAVSCSVLLLLLIACVNVTNLLLARGTQRRGEFAMRAALGAGRTRLIRQLVTESLLSSMIGGALGLLVASFGIRALVALSPVSVPRVNAIGFDGAVFAFAFAVTTLIGLVTGLIPALHAWRADLVSGIQQNSARATPGNQTTRRALVVAEVALALVLLLSAGLLFRSLQNLFAIAPGFDPSHLLTLQVQVSGRGFSEDSARERFFAQAAHAVRRVPGVTLAAVTSLLPFSGDQYGVYGAQFEDRRSYNVFRYAVSPGYFETMRIPLLRGRLLDDRDTASAQPAAVISESIAKREFPHADPIGKRVHIGPLNRPWYIVAGVVGDVRQASLADNQLDAVYITPAQSWFADDVMSVVVRVPGEPMTLAPAVENAIWSVNKDQPIVRVASMHELLAKSASERRFAMIVLETFALSALALAAIGLYGLMAGSVTERTREIGIRSALGASRQDVVRFIVRQGMTLTAIGIAIGLMAGWAATQALVMLLFGVSRLDPTTYLAVIGLLTGVSVIACYVPAWRAARIDPCITLRLE